MIPDPKYYDIYHSCQKEPFMEGYRDCFMPCPEGLVYCQERCEYATESCTAGKIPYRCKPCRNFYLSRGIYLNYGFEYE